MVYMYIYRCIYRNVIIYVFICKLQQMHSQYPRQQATSYPRNQTVQMSNRGGNAIPSNIVNNGNSAGASMQSRQTHSHQPPNSAHVPIYVPYPPQYTQPARNMSHAYHGLPYSNHPIYLPQMQWIQAPHRSNSGVVPTLQSGPALNSNVTATSVSGANAPQQQPQVGHQTQMSQHYLPQAVNPTSSMYQVPAQPQQQKKEKKILEIINPETGKDVLADFKNLTAGANAASTSVDTQIPGQSAPVAAIQQLADSHDAVHMQSSTPAPIMLGRIDADSYNIDQRELLEDVPQPPHTPVVSAIADGPSVDIPPKQTKNIKRKYVHHCQ